MARIRVDPCAFGAAFVFARLVSPWLRLQLSSPPKCVHVQICTVDGLRSRTLRRLQRLRRLAQQPARFEDVVRNLRNPDPKIRISAVRLLRETGYAEAISPLAAVVNDQVNEIQLEAIDAELSFFLVEPVPTKKHVALVVEVRTEGRAPAAFELGPLAVWPKPVPAELVDALLQAVDDDNKKVRIEAIYTLGVIGSRATAQTVRSGRRAAAQSARPLRCRPSAPAPPASSGRLQVKSAGDALLKAVNDSNAEVRYASIRALGEIRRRTRDSGADRTAQLLRQRRRRMVGARCARPDCAPVERAALPVTHSADKDPVPSPRRRRGPGARGRCQVSVEPFVTDGQPGRLGDGSRGDVLRALQEGPRQLSRLASSTSCRLRCPCPRSTGYFVELGPSSWRSARRPAAGTRRDVRRNLVTILGALGDQSTVLVADALQRGSQSRCRDGGELTPSSGSTIKMTAR